MKKLSLLIGSFCLIIAANSQLKNNLVGANKAINPYQYSIVKTQSFTKASVSCAHPLASMVGAEIMKQGGNAFDAVIATQLTLAVVYPGAGNIGGVVFWLGIPKKVKILP